MEPMKTSSLGASIQNKSKRPHRLWQGNRRMTEEKAMLLHSSSGFIEQLPRSSQQTTLPMTRNKDSMEESHG